MYPGHEGFPSTQAADICQTRDYEKGPVAAEKQVVFEIDDFTIIKDLLYWLQFFVKYPKSFPASSFLLFIQECLLGIKDSSVKHSQKYRSFLSAYL